MDLSWEISVHRRGRVRVPVKEPVAGSFKRRLRRPEASDPRVLAPGLRALAQGGENVELVSGSTEEARCADSNADSNAMVSVGFRPPE